MWPSKTPWIHVGIVDKMPRDSPRRSSRDASYYSLFVLVTHHLPFISYLPSSRPKKPGDSATAASRRPPPRTALSAQDRETDFTHDGRCSEIARTTRVRWTHHWASADPSQPLPKAQRNSQRTRVSGGSRDYIAAPRGPIRTLDHVLRSRRPRECDRTRFGLPRTRQQLSKLTASFDGSSHKRRGPSLGRACADSDDRECSEIPRTALHAFEPSRVRIRPLPKRNGTDNGSNTGHKNFNLKRNPRKVRWTKAFRETQRPLLIVKKHWERIHFHILLHLFLKKRARAVFRIFSREPLTLSLSLLGSFASTSFHFFKTARKSLRRLWELT